VDKDGNITGSFKKSKGGKLKLVKINGAYQTVKQAEHTEIPDELVTVFENGGIIKQWTFEEVKALANK
jgi:nicotinamide phosphoribosyltransferase